MSTEPDYLAPLGEFATLKNAIGSWYHQDAYLDFDTDREIWADIYFGHDGQARSRLEHQIAELLKRSNPEVLQLWNSEAHSHSFTDAAEVRAFLTAMLHFFKEQPQ